jgi:hypothetical protein
MLLAATCNRGAAGLPSRLLPLAQPLPGAPCPAALLSLLLGILIHLTAGFGSGCCVVQRSWCTCLSQQLLLLLLCCWRCACTGGSNAGEVCLQQRSTHNLSKPGVQSVCQSQTCCLIV